MRPEHLRHYCQVQEGLLQGMGCMLTWQNKLVFMVVSTLDQQTDQLTLLWCIQR